MPGRLLDSSFLVPMLRGQPGLRERMLPGRNYLSSTILGELLLGALLSGRADENLDRVRRFAATVTVLTSTPETAEHYARVGHRLETLGRRLPQNDQWIAATAIQHGLLLVTRDQHFLDLGDLIEGLFTEAW